MKPKTYSIMEFSKTEWEIIDHRLSVPDAIADALEEQFDWQLIEDRARDIHEKGQTEIDWSSEIDVEVVKESLEGSTFFADIEEEKISGKLNKGQIMSYYKAAYSLEEKLNVEVQTI